MNFGTRTSEEESFAIMDRALGHGLNFFDTADRYGREVGLGHTEELIGRWLAQGGGGSRSSGDQGVRRDGGGAERPGAVGVPHPARL